MPHVTDRSRKIRFCSDFGDRAVKDALNGMLTRKGQSILDVLPDEVLAELTERMAADWRFAQHINLRNRNATRVAAE